MRKGIITITFCIISYFIFTSCVIADSNDGKLISENTKYYKTIDYYLPQTFNVVSSEHKDNFSITYEVSEDEYNSAKVQNYQTRNSGTVETTYKKMTTSLYKNGSYYRYKNVLLWKNIPSTRSYDIIGIGHFQTVRVHGNTHFEQYYCFTSGACSTTYLNYPQTFSTGAGTSFPLPSGDLISLKQTFYFDVEKNTPLTIVTQDAYGDYSHATSNISLTNSQKYTVNSSGISLNSSIVSYYDTISNTIVSLDEIW